MKKLIGLSVGMRERLACAFEQQGRSPRAAIEAQWLVFRGIGLRGLDLLDVGAGDGSASAYAAARGAASVTALEPEAAGSSAGAVAAARSLHAALGYQDRIQILEERLEALAGGARYDLILVNAAINHFDEQACARLHRDAAARAAYWPFLERLASLCRPGGRLIVVDCSRRNLFPDLGLRNPIMKSINWRIHQRPRLWAQLLGEAGFRHPRIDWLPVTRKAGLAPLLSLPWVAYCINSVFRLVMEKPKTPGSRA